MIKIFCHCGVYHSRVRTSPCIDGDSCQVSLIRDKVINHLMKYVFIGILKLCVIIYIIFVESIYIMLCIGVIHYFRTS